MKPRDLKHRTHLNFEGQESRTEQAHKGDCDIDQIMARARNGQSPDYMRENAGVFDEAATPIEYLDALLVTVRANTLFEEQPSHIRNRFQNDPSKFLEFVKNPANREEMVQLKMLKPTPPLPKQAQAQTPPESSSPEPTPPESTPPSEA